MVNGSRFPVLHTIQYSLLTLLTIGSEQSEQNPEQYERGEQNPFHKPELRTIATHDEYASRAQMRRRPTPAPHTVGPEFHFDHFAHLAH